MNNALAVGIIRSQLILVWCLLHQLHLVDLAGSERIKKTQVNGRILNEAQAINLSLHYLEQAGGCVCVCMCGCVCLHIRTRCVRDFTVGVCFVVCVVKEI